jgi:predicted lactoylglutathione lyase
MYNGDSFFSSTFNKDADRMKSEEIFRKSVEVMKQLLTSDGMKDAIKRAKARREADNEALLAGERERLNEVVRKVADAGGSASVLEGAAEELIDAMVLRYLRNRDIFLKTFPDGIEEIDPDPVAIWAAIMISPMDEPREGK